MKVVSKPMPQPYRLQIVEDDHASLATTMDQAWEEIKDKVEAPGFRPGQVPRTVAEKKVGLEKLYKSALNVILDKGIRESKLNVFEVVDTIVEWHTDKAPLIMVATCFLAPKVVASDYLGLKVDYKNLIVGEQEIESTLTRLAFGESEEILVNGPVDKDNIASVSFVITDKKTQKTIGTQKEHSARISQSRYGFEASLEGKVAGDSYELEVDLPNDFFNVQLRGRPVQFHVDVIKVVQLNIPATDDALAKKIGFESLIDMKAKITEDLTRDKQRADRLSYADAVLGAAISRTEFTPIPDRMIKSELDQILQMQVDDTNNKQRTTLTVEQVLSQLGLDREKWYSSQWQRGVRKVHLNLMLDFIVTQQQIVVTEQECESELATILSPGADKSNVNMEQLRAYVARKKAQDYLIGRVETVKALKAGVDNGQ